ncbi:hypothetical protein [Vagococcus silagei]|uniref:hypothetical protein n=1 Tax=Vagococcus silagei TaxID=2508885 RepID=UPI001EF6BFBA|nr:hypothetical protein [Vagococcus silagei]
MLKTTIKSTLIILLLFLTGCSAKLKENSFPTDEDFEKAIVSKSSSYSTEEYQNGEVPLHEYIKMKGKIIKSDSKSKKIKKGDRFVLLNDGEEYQIFNEQDKELKIEDEITVYGEYYGFVKTSYIELE